LLVALTASGHAFEFQVNLKSTLHLDLDVSKNRPVTKVITLLKDMKIQLEQEAAEDEEIYEKMACWCETNDKEKTKAIEDAEARIEDLKAEILRLAAASARLSAEIKNLEKDVAENKEALDKATALRTKELAEFNGAEKDMLQSIGALKAAITVLAKHHGGSLLQSNQEQVVLTLQHELEKHASLLQGVLTSSQKKAIAAFVQAPEDYFDDAPAFNQANYQPAYAPQSGEIFGILKQMKETFENNLSQSQKDELANQKAFEDLKEAKEGEITAGEVSIDTKTQELATTDARLAEAKQDVEDTTASLSADEKFLMNLKETCQMTDSEFEQRQKDRQLEIEAVSKALAILSSDDAHDLFTKTFNPALVEKANSQHSKRRVAAAKVLSSVAEKLDSPRLAALATRVRLDAFTKVKKAIDDMVAQLLQDKKDEIKHRDFCIDGLNQNERETEKNERTKADLIEKIDGLTLQIDELAKAIEASKAEIAEMQIQMKRAGEDREKENKEFQMTVVDQRATQKLLNQALDVLRKFYSFVQKAALIQQKQEPAGPPPPPGFKAYKKSAAAGGVMGMIQQIINDAKAMEAEALQAEEDAQKAYEAFVKDTNASIEESQKAIINKSEEKAKAETAKTETEESKEEVGLTLEQLSTEAADLHKSCDFTVKNFEIRQTARDEEIEALKQAKAILSGAKFSEFLQSN